MKRFKLSGHSRVLIPLGIKSHTRANPSGGWKLECICGWSENALNTKRDAETAYAKHISETMPICIVCSEKKPIRMMSKSYHGLCTTCSTKKSRLWAKENPNEWERMRRKSHLKKKYGITIEEYDKMVNAQKGVCAICKGSLTDSRGFRPHIDHCHKSNVVRGVLCGDCNKGLGLFKDDKERIFNAYKYLTNESNNY